MAGLQWVVDGYALVFASLILTAGGLGDRYGRRRVYILGVGVFALGTLICGLSPTLGVLIVGRVVEGFGAALLLPGTLSIIGVTFPEPRERAQAISIWATVSGLALIGGPLLGGLLVDRLGWHSVFWINLPIAAITVVLTRRAVAESANPDARRMDLPGQALSILFFGAAIYAVIEGNRDGWSSDPIVGAWLLAAISGLAFILVERRRASPLLRVELFLDRVFAAANLSAALVLFALGGILFVLTLFLQNVQGHTAIETGIRLLPGPVSYSLCTPFGGRLIARFGSRALMAVGLIFSSSGLLMLTQLSADSSYLWIALPLVLLGIGVSLVIPASVAAAVGAVPATQAGMASGTINTARQAGSAIGVAVFGALLASQATGRLHDGVAALGLAPSSRAQLTAAAARGGPIEQIGLPGGIDGASLQRVVNGAFASGMHLALLVSGLLLLAGALLVALWTRTWTGMPHPLPASSVPSEEAVPAIVDDD